MVGRGVTFFASVLLAIIYLGFYCKKNKIFDISMFNMVFLASFIFGGTFPYVISFFFVVSLEENTDHMVLFKLNVFLVFLAGYYHRGK